MANRRMFSKDIVESDAFLDLPAESKVLYFYLNMAADDDGFCSNPRAIMRQCNATDDAMRVLIAKKFVLVFQLENGSTIYLIKHWRVHNYIRKDTYHESRYKELIEEIYIDRNNAYTDLPEAVNDPSTARPRDVNDPSTEVSIGKDSIELEKDKDSVVLNKQISAQARASDCLREEQDEAVKRGLEAVQRLNEKFGEPEWLKKERGG